MAKQGNGNSGGIIIPEIVVDGNAGNTFSDGAVDGNGNVIIDPTAIAAGSGGSGDGSGGDTAGEPRKRRGRKPGSAGSAKSSKSSLDINGVEAILLSAHGMLAALTKAPEFMLDKEEAKSLATGISNVSRHYDMQATQKSLDWANLFMVVGMVYAPRIMAINLRRGEEKRARKNAEKEGNVTVFPFNSGGYTS